jgi:peptide/nickel transport system permease protein
VSRARYIGVRTLHTIVLIWLAATLLFFLFRAMPGDFTAIMLRDGASPENIAAFEERWGLNDPLYIQYLRYITNLLTFDAGTSLKFQRPVWEYVSDKLFNSFILVAPAITFSYILGSIVGTIAGTKPGSWFEKHGILGFLVTGTIPEFFTGIILIIIFAGIFNIFPSGGMVSLNTVSNDVSFFSQYLTTDFLWHYFLPFLTIVLRFTFLPTLIMRTSVAEVLGQDFIQYHRVTGVPASQRMAKVAKHASLPVITLYPVSMARALSGLVLIETVFNWPGIGFALVRAVLELDFPVAQFVFFLVAAFVIIANFGVDIVYGIIDPRVSIDE